MNAISIVNPCSDEGPRVAEVYGLINPPSASSLPQPFANAAIQAGSPAWAGSRPSVGGRIASITGCPACPPSAATWGRRKSPAAAVAYSSINVISP